MMSSLWNYLWKLSLIGVAASQILALIISGQANAQITPDNTLGAESSVVTPNVEIQGLPSDRVDEGAIRGANLFHSFQEFNVREGRGVYFTNPQGIENILSRVTGASRSEILGRLGVLGNANLFLMNPNGIVFGQNASLDVEGSFVASTASSVKFSNGLEFSATAPQSTPLLTISVPVGLQYGDNPSVIQVQGGNRPTRTTAELFDTQAGLQVPSDQTLALVGSNISLSGATLKTPGGRIELGSVAPNSFVSLTPINQGFSFSYGAVEKFGDIQLVQNSAVDASGSGGGDIQVAGRRVSLSDGSVIVASTLGTERGRALVVNASELVELSGRTPDNRIPSGFYAQARENATGDAGELKINTRQLLVQGEAQISTITFGAGKGGNLTINATEKVELIEGSGLFAQVNSNGKGDGGDLTINTRQLLVQDGARVSVNTSGEGNGGKLTIDATEKVALIGNNSRLLAEVNSDAKGNAGDVKINTRQLLVQDGARVSVDTFGEGNGGKLTIGATEKVELMGNNSRVSARVNSNGKGDGGDLTINTQQLLVQDGAQVSASTFGEGDSRRLTINAAEKVELIGGGSGLFAQVNQNGKGDGGDLTINTQQLLVQDGAQVNVNTSGEGNGGNLTIGATEKVELIGGGSGLFAQVNPNAKGDGGDLSINTQQFLVQDGARVSISTSGEGNGGNLTIGATEKVELIGGGSGLFAQVNSNGKGNGGDLTINTQQLLVQDKAQVNVNTSGEGNGGNLTIGATEKVELIGGGSGLFARTTGEKSFGNAGSLKIDTQQLLVRDGADVSASTSSAGKGGDLTINATEKVELIGNGSRMSVQVNSNAKGNAGNLTINTQQLLVRDGVEVSASTFGEGNGGNLTINATEKVELIGGGSGLFAQVNPNAKGDGGDLSINTQQFLVQDGARVSISTSGEGNAGNSIINATKKVELIGNGSGLFAQVNSNVKGDGGDLTINTRQLLVQSGADVSVSTDGEGNGGKLTINAAEKVELRGNGSRLSARVNPNAKGNGGDLTINTRQLLVQSGADVSVSTNGEGNGGKLTINAAEKVELTGNGSNLFAQATLNAKGNGGDLTINTQQLLMRGGADVSASTFGEGNGGKLTINATEKVELIGTQLFAVARPGSKGAAGDITIKTGELWLQNGGKVETSTWGVGNSGNLIVDATKKVELIGTAKNNRSGLLAVAHPGSTGTAGDIRINTGELRVENGAEVSAKTFGPGKGGNLTVYASEKVELVGVNGQYTSGLFSQTEGSTGAAGDITVKTGEFRVENGAQVFSNVGSTAKGNAGNITIEAKSVTLQNEGELGVRIQGDNQSENNQRGTITIKSENLTVKSNALIQGDVDGGGKGRGADINLIATGAIAFIGGETAPTGESTRITLGVLPGGVGSGGNLYIKAGSLILKDGAIVKASAQGEAQTRANAGSITIEADVVDISGSVPKSGLPSGIFSSTDTSGNAGDIIVNAQKFRIANGAVLSARSKGDGRGGNIRVNAADSFEAANGGQLVTTTFGQGQAGDIFINAKNQIVISGSDPNYTERLAKFPNSISPLVANDIKEIGPNSGLFTYTEPLSIGQGGNIGIQGNSLTLKNSQINARTQGQGIAGGITINVNGLLSATDSDIITAAEQSNGGAIAITAKDIRLFGNSDITTNVGSDTGDGGNINLTANSIIAFDDSDILTFANGGKGGDITFNTPAFFGQNYKPAPSGTDPRTLDGNNRVDVNASGRVSGAIALPDTSFIQNSLSELPENPIDTSSLIANSCIARNSRQQEGSFTITGSGGLPSRPGDALMSLYTFRAVRTIPNTSPSANSTRRPWQKGDPIVEPQGVYQLPSGHLVLSRECAE